LVEQAMAATMRLFDRTFLEFPIRQGMRVTLADYKDEKTLGRSDAARVSIASPLRAPRVYSFGGAGR
jgi:hypothetical protein